MKLYKISALFLMAAFVGWITWMVLAKASRPPSISAELQEEVANFPLKITGNIPNWLSGTLVRNGPIKVTVDGQSNSHWFDGLAMLHAFSFQEGMVSYSNKFLRTDAYHTVFDKGSLDYSGFAADPCRSLFKRFFTLFVPTSHEMIQNANVNVAKMANEYVALTELPLPVQFNVKTLDTLGVLDYQDQLPKSRCWESAHPHQDRRQKETLNYLIEFDRISSYILYRLQEGSSKRNIIAKLPVEQPSYMHSFALTTNYLILTEFPLVVKPLDLIIKGKPFIKNFSWQPERGTQFIVVDRHSGHLVGQYVTKPFFAFHHANAYEEEGTIYLDIVTYENADVIIGDSLYVNSHANTNNYPSRLERFSLFLQTGQITSEVLLARSNEFPRINDHLEGHRHTYVYAVGLSGLSLDHEALLNSEALYKVNTMTKELLIWSEEGCSPGEPVFVAAPGSQEEDEGVILAVILDSICKDSFLLILDAKSFQEMGRARLPHAIPAGFHGEHFP